jgi:hypothetical protein
MDQWFKPMYSRGMWTTKSLKPALDKGVETVRKADVSLRLCIGLVMATLVVCLCTLIAVLASRPARA